MPMGRKKVLAGLLCAVLVTCGCGQDTERPDDVPEPGVCGDGILDAGEVCDGALGVPETCLAYDAEITWEEGGRPGCSSDCASLNAGTCVERVSPVPECGNGLVEDGEVCDGEAGVPETCLAYDAEKSWGDGGRPGCSSDCASLNVGTCVERVSACGNGLVEDDEVCDGEAGVPETCLAFDADRQWQDGGRPGCASDCRALSVGTCRESFAECGDGFAEDHEVCDGTDGVPVTCAEYDATRRWQDGGRPACSETCDAVVQGTCEIDDSLCGNGQVDDGEACDSDETVEASCDELDGSKFWNGRPTCSKDCSEIVYTGCREAVTRTLRFYSYNVQFEYESGGGSEVLPRAIRLYEILSAQKPADRPAIWAIVEASPQWHAEAVSAMFEKLGYAWAEPDETYLTEVLYQKDRFEWIENQWKRLPSSYESYDPEHPENGSKKTIVFAAVLKEKSTGKIFIAMSNHWEPNLGSYYIKDAGMMAPIARDEMTRVATAKVCAELVRSLREKYPEAHVLFGGDLNTVDLTILYKNPVASAILGKTNADLVKIVNTMITEDIYKLPEDFAGSHEVFMTESGLSDARETALDAGILPSESDVATTHDPGIPEFVTALGIPVVIDYTFFSENLKLDSYRVVVSTAHDQVSDHYPLETIYRYRSTP